MKQDFNTYRLKLEFAQNPKTWIEAKQFKEKIESMKLQLKESTVSKDNQFKIAQKAREVFNKEYAAYEKMLSEEEARRQDIINFVIGENQ